MHEYAFKRVKYFPSGNINDLSKRWVLDPFNDNNTVAADLRTETQLKISNIR